MSRGRAVVCSVMLLMGTVWAASGAPAVAADAKTPTAWDPRLQPIADKVAELRNLAFDHPVTAEFLTDAAFEKKVAIDKGKLSKQDKAELERSQGQARARRLVGPG